MVRRRRSFLEEIGGVVRCYTGEGTHYHWEEGETYEDGEAKEKRPPL